MNEKKKSIILLGVVGLLIIVIISCIVASNLKAKKIYDSFFSYYNSAEPTLVLLGKEGCSYCEAFHPELEFMSEYYGFDYKYISLDKVNTSQYKKIIETLEIDPSKFGTPYTVILKSGEKIDELSGAVEETELLTFLKENNFVSQDKQLLIDYIGYDDYEKTLKSENVSVIGIGKTTCIYCKMVKSTLNNIIKKYGVDIKYVNLDLLSEEEYNSLYASLEFFSSKEWGTPSFLIVKNGKLLDYISGAETEEKFLSKFKEYGLIGE